MEIPEHIYRGLFRGEEEALDWFKDKGYLTEEDLSDIRMAVKYRGEGIKSISRKLGQAAARHSLKTIRKCMEDNNAST